MESLCKSEPSLQFTDSQLINSESDSESLASERQEGDDLEPDTFTFELADGQADEGTQLVSAGNEKAEFNAADDMTLTQATSTSLLERSAVLKRKTYDLATKRKAIDLLCSGKKRRCDVAKELNVSGTTLSTWMKQRDALSGYAGSMDRKSMHRPKHPSLDAMLLKWIEDVRRGNSSIRFSGALLQEKAREVALAIGMNDFRASSGWLSKFTARHNLRQYKKEKVKATFPTDGDVLSKALKSYVHDNIYTVDEFGLFYGLLPGATLEEEDRLCSEGQRAEERVTVLAAASLTGEKLPLLVVGREDKPVCLSGIRTMPCQYDSNSNSWVTKEILFRWLISVDGQLERKVAMLVRDWVGNGVGIQQWLRNIEIFVLPSSMRPLKKNISNVKVMYRSLMLRKVLPRGDAGQHAKLTVLDALMLLRESWQSVNLENISACFCNDSLNAPASTNQGEAHKQLDVNLATEFTQIDDEVRTHPQQADDLITALVDNSVHADVEVTQGQPPMTLTAFEVGEVLHKLERHLLSMADADEALTNFYKFKEAEFKLRIANQETSS